MLKQLLKKNLNVFSLAVMIKVETTVKEKFDVFSLAVMIKVETLLKKSLMFSVWKVRRHRHHFLWREVR